MRWIKEAALLIVGLLTVLNASAAGQIARYLPATLWPTLSAALWGLLFTHFTIRLLRPQASTARLIPQVALALTAYGAWNVLWLIAFAQSDYDHGRIGFQMAATSVVLIPVWLAAGWVRRRTANF